MNKRNTLSVTRQLVLFAMFGALMFISKLIMESLPNIHLVATFIVAFTVVYRTKALIPIYVFVFLNGIYMGFSTWWIPYLYIWTVLWAAVMLLPRNMPPKIRPVVYCGIAALHGLLFGTLYAPCQALAFHFDFPTTVKWIIAGLPYDCIHAVGNLVMGMLTVPLILVLEKLEKKSGALKREK